MGNITFSFGEDELSKPDPEELVRAVGRLVIDMAMHRLGVPNARVSLEFHGVGEGKHYRLNKVKLGFDPSADHGNVTEEALIEEARAVFDRHGLIPMVMEPFEDRTPATESVDEPVAVQNAPSTRRMQ